MKIAEEHFDIYATNYLSSGDSEDYNAMDVFDFINAIAERDNEWRQKIQDAFNSTMNFHTREILKKLLED